MINRIFEKKSIRTVLLVLMILLASVSLLQGIRNACRDSQDFQWDAAKVFSLGINPYDESVMMNPSGILDELGYDEYYLQMEANQFPSLLCILLPFTVLKPLTARYVWIACNLIFTALIILLLRKTFLKDLDPYWFNILSLLMIAGTPYRNQIGVGQHTLFAFCFFLIAVYFSEFRKKENEEKTSEAKTEEAKTNKSETNESIINEVITMIALFICFFKYTLTVPLTLYFVYKKRYKEIIVPVIAHGILTVVSAVWLKDSFINMIIKPLKVASNLSAEGGLDISALLQGSPVAYVLTLVVMILLLFLSVKLPEGHDRCLMAVLTLWSVIVTYHRTYDFFVIIAVSGLFDEFKGTLNKADSYDEDGNVPSTGDIKRKEPVYMEKLHLLYIVTMLSVFFVLRIFSENLPSKLIVGGMYYILTIAVSYVAVKCMCEMPQE